MNAIPKSQMTEEDIKLQFITPALLSKWDIGHISMETQITDGKVNLRGNLVHRAAPKHADYILYINANNPIAIVEAKDNKHSISYGLQQAMTYAQMLDVPFAYSSNGDGFEEHDFLTGKERQLTLDEFPLPEELTDRYYKGANEGAGLNDSEKEIIQQPYYTSQTTYEPRYYQRIAVNRTLDAIARGQNRILLVMATGTGKTYTAFQIVWRLLQSGMKHKVLYLADRNILVDQTIQQDFAPLEKTIHKINVSRDDKSTITSHEVYFSLYQQLVGDDDQEHFSELFTPDFFDLIIVDECHRGSAKEESRWRRILEYFTSATQIGMTATPKETRYVSNISYFGEPVYTYSLKEGIEDGFLAPFRVINVKTNIGDGWRPYKGQCDIYGNEIEDRIYTNSDYDYNIVIEDRIEAVAREITDYLKSTDRMAKTIVFCATEDAAERMRIALTNLNSDMVKENPDYVVRITGSDTYGKSKLDYFISVGSKYPVIATTSKLLSTGADCKMTKLIVIDEMISSMTEFKQIIGRGTRLREKEGKLSFVVMDFRGVSRLFADPEWDGPIEMDDNFQPGQQSGKDGQGGGRQPDDPSTDLDNPMPVVDENGCMVRVINVEGSVGNISTWITAALRNEQFFSLAELNDAIQKKLKVYNARKFQKKECSRLDLFLGEEKPLLMHLPATSYELAEWKQATVQFNYHIAVDKMYYSVPYQYIKNKVDVRVTDTTIEIFYHNTRIASHRRLYGRPGQYSTVTEHMPEDHQKYLEWDGDRFRKWGNSIGPNTGKVVNAILTSGRIEQQSYRSCMGLLKLSEKYSPGQLEAACEKALSFTAGPSYKSIKNILAAMKDSPDQFDQTASKESAHGIIRGAKHYGGGRS